jgi:hypothetical protein
MGDDNKLLIRLATPSDYKNLSNFRIKQFQNNEKNFIKDSALLSRQRGSVLVIENIKTKEIISTMQVECIKSADQFIDIYSSSYKIDPDSKLFPSIYLSRVATVRPLRKSGFNSYLRLLVLKMAQKRIEISTLTGIVFEGDSRVPLLHEIGYQSYFIEPEKNTYFSSSRKVLFAWLERKEFNKAAVLLESKIGSLKKDFSINIKALSNIF